MKKSLLFILATIVTISFAGCVVIDDEKSPSSITDTSKETTTSTEVKADVPAEPVSAEEPTPPEESKSDLTTGQKNALKSAKQYLDALPFSHKGLIEQLEFDEYSNDEATYAADNCEADWNEQAVKSAKQYLDAMAFSRQSLIEQLEFDGYSNDEATHGAEANGY